MRAPEETRITVAAAAPSPAPSLTSIPLTIRLFGVMEVEREGIALPRTRTAKEKWLLALLVLRHRESVDRTWLAGTLWPDSSDTQALGNLRRSLNNLRKVLGEHGVRLIAPTPRRIAMDISGAACDVISFDAAIARGDIASLREATDLYRGPLLQGCDEEWVLPERAVREQQYLTALETLAAHAAEQNHIHESIHCLWLVVGADPFRESAQRALLEALAASGDLSAATLAYRQLRLRLHHELQTEPAPETTALYQRLRAAARSRLTPVEERRGDARSSLLHVPRPISDLVGRTGEIGEVAALLLGSSRLVTLTGSGGIGKTRLSIAVVEAIAAEFPAGLWFVDLAPLTNGTLVPQVVASKLGVREYPRRPLAESVAGFLAAKRALLILDNCEHLLGACARFADPLLQTCPNVRILATSRQPLGITGENIYHVSPLGLPAGNTRPSAIVQKILEADSVRLFVERAMEASAAFRPTDRNAEAIAQVCRRLDGIPLAIELAAARVRALSVEQIAIRLDDRFRLLIGRSTTALPRHQTLRACTDWSYDLLTESERALFRRLSVFAGGWTLDAAEIVCAGNGVERDTILDILSALIDKSLVAMESGEGAEARYRLLDTIREYAQGRLLESGETAESRLRHLEYFLCFAETAGVQLTEPDQISWLARLETEQDNLRAAFRTAIEGGAFHPETAALRLCGALQRFWERRGHVPEGRQWCASALAQTVASGRTQARADALNCAGALAVFRGEHAAGRAYLEEGLAIYRELGHRSGIAASLTNLGLVARELGDYAGALPYYAESLRLYKEIGHRSRTAALLSHMGLVAQNMGDYDLARSYYEESLSLRRATGDMPGIGASVHGLGLLTFRQGDYAAARRLYEEALHLYKQIGDRPGIAWVLNNLGLMAYRCGEYAAARAYHAESLCAFQEIGAPLGIVYSLEAFADLAQAESEASAQADEAEIERALHLWGAAERLREGIGMPVPPGEQAERERQISWARSVLGEVAFAAAYEAGRKMMVEQAVEYALFASGDCNREQHDSGASNHFSAGRYMLAAAVAPPAQRSSGPYPSQEANDMDL